MKTIGVNTDEQIDDYKSKVKTEKDRKELSLKSMLISCFCYGGVDKDSWNFERYISPYVKELGDELFEEVYNEQVAFLNKNCTVKENVYEDCEGLNYNSLIIK